MTGASGGVREPARPPRDLTDRVFQIGGELAYIVLFSFGWLLLALPIVTIPAATTAAYGTIGVHVVDGGKGYLGPFWESFKASFKSVTLPGLCLLALVVLAGFNSFFYLRAVDRTTLMLVLAGVQAVLAASALIVSTFFFMFAGLAYGRGHLGRAPRVREAAKVALAHPGASLVILVSTVGIPAVLVWLSLWQFVIFAVGAVCYANVQILTRSRIVPSMP